jgi:uncharacterized protein YqjF (DUF2071 family)
VKCGDEPGIHFLGEWLTNRLAVRLGPPIFGLPYHHGKIDYRLEPDQPILQGRVQGGCDAPSRLEYEGRLTPPKCCRLAVGSPPPENWKPAPSAFAPLREIFQPCEAGTISAWLMERYTAFNAALGRKKFFRVWHPPWPQCAAEIDLKDTSLLTRPWPFFTDAKLIGSNYSPGFDEVWMGRPHRIRLLN